MCEDYILIQPLDLTPSYLRKIMFGPVVEGKVIPNLGLRGKQIRIRQEIGKISNPRRSKK